MLQASDRYVLAAGCKREPKIPWRALGSPHLPQKPAHAHPYSISSGHKRRVKMFGLLAAVAIFLAAGSRPAAAAAQPYGALKVPDFSIMANDGMTYAPDYLKGNVVLIMFWATWCPYCRHAMPHMNTFADEYSNSEFTLLGICNSKDPTAWHNYIQEHHLQWPQYLDRDARMGHLFGARGVPNFFLIDKDGYLVAHWVGWDDSLTKQVEKLIDHTLAQPRRQ
jgi:thiol-disulfide isomerase/thioredoxin